MEIEITEHTTFGTSLAVSRENGVGGGAWRRPFNPIRSGPFSIAQGVGGGSGNPPYFFQESARDTLVKLGLHANFYANWLTSPVFMTS